MAEYDLIERNKIFEKVTELYRYSKGDMHIAYRELLDFILDMSAADVQPVKHGKWIDCTSFDPYEKSYEQNYEFKCSNCGHKIYNKPNDDDNLFCGHCSAKMTLREPEAIKKPDIQLLRDAVDLIKKAKDNNSEAIKG